MAERLDIFQVLKNVNGKNLKWYDSLSPEEQKQFVPFLTMKWMSFTKDDVRVEFINEFVNRYVFSLYKHPDLLYNLLTVCGSGSENERVSYRKKNVAKDKKTLSLRVISEYYGISEREAQAYLKIITVDDLVDMASAVGLASTEITALKKEYK